VDSSEDDHELDIKVKSSGDNNAAGGPLLIEPTSKPACALSGICMGKLIEFGDDDVTTVLRRCLWRRCKIKARAKIMINSVAQIAPAAATAVVRLLAYVLRFNELKLVQLSQ
jgi:hypothetical protein